jgi:hypothetical protein
VATRHLVDLEIEAFAGDAALEGSRKEPIVRRRQNPRGHLGPGLKWPGLGEHALARRTLKALVGLSDRRIDVVKEDLSKGVRPLSPHRSVALENVGDRLVVPDVAPPFTRGLSRLGDHRRQEDEQGHGNARRHQRARERAERLRDDHQLGVARQRAGDGIRVIARSGVWIV